MRELIFILLIILVLLALTAVRYRKQIAGLIGLARMLKEVKQQIGQAGTLPKEQPRIQLVSCANCGVWIPETKAVPRSGMNYCSSECAMVRVT